MTPAHLRTKVRRMLRSLGIFPYPPPSGPWGSDTPAWERYFRNWLSAHRIQFEHWHVRPPSHEWSVLNGLLGHRSQDSGDDWHQDGLGHLSERMNVGVWSNTQQTLIRKKGDRDNLTLFQPEPYEVVLFSNAIYEHRPPPMSEEEAAARWFVRFYTTNRTPEYGYYYWEPGETGGI